MTQQIQNTVDGWLTGVGRLVGGDPYTIQTRDHQGNEITDPKKQKYFVAIAFPKNDPQATGFNETWAFMQQAAALHPQASQFAAQNWQGFHFKYDDGDDPKFKDRAGYPGHHILKFQNGFQPQLFDENRNKVQHDPEVIYKGCYVRVQASAKQNGATGAQAGIFLNVGMIQRCGHGDRIHTGPDFSSMIANAPVQLPAGASATPLAPVGGAPGAVGLPGGVGLPAGLPGAPVGGVGLPGGVPAAAGMPAGLPGAVGAPAGLPGGVPAAAGVGLPGAVGLPAGAPVGLPGAPPAAAAAPVDKQSLMVNPQANYAQLIQQGWTDEALIANGHMRHPYSQ